MVDLQYLTLDTSVCIKITSDELEKITNLRTNIIMCGRTACTLAPDDVCKACSYKGSRSNNTSKKDGQSLYPVWRDPPGGQQYYPSYNIAPGAHTPVIISSKHYKEELGEITERVIQPMRWGLVPSWHKGDPNKVEYETNNCRAEGMLDKRTYKVPLDKGRRCVVLADGFFEWKRDKSNKQPYFIYFPKSNQPQEIKENIKTEASQIKQKVKDNETSVKQETKNYGIDIVIKQEPVDDGNSESNTGKMKADSSVNEEQTDSCIKEEIDGDEMNGEDGGCGLLTMAGVFDVWNPPDGSAPLYSYSVITVAASPAMSWIHHRMPAILTCDEEVNDWLDYGNVPISKAAKLIRPVECIQLHPVSSVVNNSRNKTPDCIKQIDLEKPKASASSNFMTGWLSKGKKDKDVNKNETTQTKHNESTRSLDKSPKKSASSNFMAGWLSKAKNNSSSEDPPAKKRKL